MTMQKTCTAIIFISKNSMKHGEAENLTAFFSHRRKSDVSHKRSGEREAQETSFLYLQVLESRALPPYKAALDIKRQRTSEVLHPYAKPSLSFDWKGKKRQGELSSVLASLIISGALTHRGGT